MKLIGVLALAGALAGALALAPAVAAPAPAAGEAREAVPETVRALVTHVVDGDTIRATALVWPGVEVKVSVRLKGVDTPELRGQCKAEKERARRARDYVRALLPEGAIVRLTEVRPDKYQGRVDARVTLDDGRDLARLLIRTGLGRPYDGGRRGSWCR
jgi:endonuclease YncB( thermonuclease family)